MKFAYCPRALSIGLNVFLIEKKDYTNYMIVTAIFKNIFLSVRGWNFSLENDLGTLQ